MSNYQITNQRDLRRAFWEAFPLCQRKRNPRTGDRPTDTRVTFVDWIDHLCRDGTISHELAQRATLD